MNRPQLHLLCPLQYERRALLRSRLLRPSVHCCGPGAEAVRAWVRRAARDGWRPGTTVVLAGVAGGLTADRPVGSAWMITEVRDSSFDRDRWRPSLILPRPPRQPCAVVSTPNSLVDPRAKAECRARHRVELVDRESASFARAAEAAQWRWGIVRGISDGPDGRLPEDIDEWVTDDGRTRAAAVVLALARTPRLLRALLTLQRDAALAMRSVRTLLEESFACEHEQLSGR